MLQCLPCIQRFASLATRTSLQIYSFADLYLLRHNKPHMPCSAALADTVLKSTLDSEVAQIQLRHAPACMVLVESGLDTAQLTPATEPTTRKRIESVQSERDVFEGFEGLAPFCWQLHYQAVAYMPIGYTYQNRQECLIGCE